MELRARENLSGVDYPDLYRELLNALPERFQPALLRRCDPVVLVQYQREHFASADGRLRATLDYELAFYNQLGKRRISTAFPQRMPDMFLVEVKCPEGDQREVQDMLHPMTPRQGPSSKYVHGCCQLGLVPPQNYH